MPSLKACTRHLHLQTAAVSWVRCLSLCVSVMVDFGVDCCTMISYMPCCLPPTDTLKILSCPAAFVVLLFMTGYTALVTFPRCALLQVGYASSWSAYSMYCKKYPDRPDPLPEFRQQLVEALQAQVRVHAQWHLHASRVLPKLSRVELETRAHTHTPRWRLLNRHNP